MDFLVRITQIANLRGETAKMSRTSVFFHKERKKRGGGHRDGKQDANDDQNGKPHVSTQYVQNIL